MDILFKKVYHTYCAPIIFVEYYKNITIPVDSTSDLIEISLPGFSSSSMLRSNTSLQEDAATVIQLNNFAISTNSGKYKVSVFDKNDETLSDTIHEVIYYDPVNKLVQDQNFNSYIITNRDDPNTSKLYLQIQNSAEGDLISDIYLRLVYNHLDT